MPIKRKFPHVASIKDPDIQSSLRLLWDKVYGHDDQLTTAQAQLDTATSRIGILQSDVLTAQRAADNASASASTPRTLAKTLFPSGQVPTVEPVHTDHTDIVVTAKANLVTAAITITGDCGAFEITRLVAWRLKTAEPDIGLLDKPDGTNCNGYAVGIICYKDGQIYDILQDAGGTNGPQWNFQGTVDPARWRDPITPSI